MTWDTTVLPLPFGNLRKNELALNEIQLLSSLLQVLHNIKEEEVRRQTWCCCISACKCHTLLIYFLEDKQENKPSQLKYEEAKSIFMYTFTYSLVMDFVGIEQYSKY